ncbi:hypothetical protein RAS12_11985 [Achromobacter seleniivolatilans]|uniref:Uncharacterized protein n=1 Tax=Achromobacter seleniivolatilans TaxID=3047478 RepID=A0ABY9MB80_9BURK|nr:hypothetical protein [Achromobacter sp. R39]WMD23057.1 hypothetical protein RAS12_11985 [Achromobacter sp. R39]
MAIDARLSVGLASHPKTKKLIRRVGGDGAWRLVCLFLWCAANRPDGNLVGLSDEDIELAVDWAGDEGAFVAALHDVGFLDGDELSREIHDWAEHNPWVSDSGARSEKARWAALCKRYGRSGAAQRMPEYAKRIDMASGEVAKASQEHATSTQAAVPEVARTMLEALPESANSMPGALLDSASSMPIAESGSAPSPSPSPSPSLKDKTPLSACADRGADGEPSERTPPPKPDDVQEVFAYWQEAMSSPRSVLDDKRRKVIRTALKAGHSVDDLRRAIRGCSKTPHNMGLNDRGEKYNGIELILRSADQIDRFIANDTGGDSAGVGDRVAVMAALQERFPGASVTQLDGGRYRIGNRFFDAIGNAEPVL